jgi:alcohol dehydrogenase
MFQFRREKMIYIAYSDEKLESSVAKSIKSQLNYDNTKLIIYFASSRFAQNRLATSLKNEFPNVQLVGCSTSGEIMSGKMTKNSVVAMAITDEAIEDVKVELVKNIATEPDIDNAFNSFGEYFGVSTLDMDVQDYFGMILIDGLSKSEENIMDLIGNKTDITFIGGSAGDDLAFKKTFVYKDGKAYTNSAILVLIKPKVPFRFIKTQSFDYTGKKLVASKVDEKNREVIEFDNQPAVKKYAEVLGIDKKNASDKFFTNPIGLVLDRENKNIFVRSPQQAKNDRIVFYCNVLEGMEVEILHQEDMISDTKDSIRKIQEELKEIKGIINFNCILRTLQLEATEKTEDYGNIFKDIPTIGFSTYGEQYIGHINQTATMIVFGTNDNTASERAKTVGTKESTNISNPKGGNKVMSKNFYMPRVNLMGIGVHKELGEELKKSGFKKAFIVSKKGMEERGTLKKVTDVLDESGIEYITWGGVVPNPTDTSVEEGFQALTEAEGCDFLLSVGGGSYHDTAKAIGILATNGGKIHDYEGVDMLTEAAMPHVAVNTTSGTASQITRFAVITDVERRVKMVILDARITPTISVDDPELMMTMPSDLTASTGMDALTHAVEAYVSSAATLLTDTLALKAIELIAKYLRRSVWNPDDLEARDMMTWAEHIAGMAFNNGLLGYVHAMAHQLGGFYDLPHGVCNAILLPHVEEFNSKSNPKKFKDIARAMGEVVDEDSDVEGTAKALAAIKNLSKDIKIPAGLKELGVKEEDIPVLAENAIKDACAGANPRKASLEDIIEIFQRAL